MKTPLVTIVGKPNVGKSTLFNNLAGSRIAIEDSTAGTTRDRIFHKVTHPEIDFFLVDTGGLEFSKTRNTIENDMRAQVQVAIEESDLILFVVNAKEPLSADDLKVAELLRKKKSRKPVLLVLSKCDRSLDPSEKAEYYQLGLGEPLMISAPHRLGLDELVETVVAQLRAMSFVTKDSPDYSLAEKTDLNQIQVALFGRPNVGKSSLVNALLRQDKMIVSDIPGTTRDSVDALVHFDGKDYNFIDTAGLRRQGRVSDEIEHFSVLRTLSSLERCDVALLVIDSTQDIGHQDQRIANLIVEAQKGLVILVNKWDLKGESDEEEQERRKTMMTVLQHHFPFLSWAPVVFTSAVTKKNLHRIFEQIETIHAERAKRVTTAQLNTFLGQIMQWHRPSGAKAVIPKIYYITQVDVAPPHFVLFVNRKDAFHFSYPRYVENKLRERFGFTGTPVRIDLKERTRELRPRRETRR